MLFGFISTKEVVEEAGIDWFDCLLIIVIIVCLDLRTLVVMGVINQGFNQSGISLTEVIE